MSAKNSTRYLWLMSAIENHNSNDCLLWPFPTNGRGYGKVYVNGDLKYAHRYAFFLKHGHWPNPCACHACDTPACVNWRHLFEGDHFDNLRDAARKMRTGGIRLNPELVRAIRSEYVPRKPGYDQRGLAKKYNVSQYCVVGVLSGKTWKFVP